MEKKIWVIPEINNPAEISKLSSGLLTEARLAAEKTGAQASAVIFTDSQADYGPVLRRYGIEKAHIFKNALFKNLSAEAAALCLSAKVLKEKPWLMLLGDTIMGQELAAYLAVKSGSGLVTNCLDMDFVDPDRPQFYRASMGGQIYQELVFKNSQTMIVTFETRVLNTLPVKDGQVPAIEWIEVGLSNLLPAVCHLGFQPADFKTMDIAEAETVIGAGSGAAEAGLLPLVEELAELLEGAIGTTRPVADDGKIGKDRMIGQTGKTISPAVYLALGISGASHHLGGIQEAGKILAVNKDPQAPIFQNSDAGMVADLKVVLPRLIEKIKAQKRP